MDISFIRKSTEIQRLMESKAGGRLQCNDTAKIVLCIDLAANALSRVNFEVMLRKCAEI